VWKNNRKTSGRKCGKNHIDADIERQVDEKMRREDHQSRKADHGPIADGRFILRIPAIITVRVISQPPIACHKPREPHRRKHENQS
jgi:hypothetical protein